MKPLQDHPAVYPKNSRISISEQRVHKLLTAEHLQIFHSFTQPYVLIRYLKVIGYTYDHTTLGRTIEIRYGQLVHLGRGSKLLGLLKSILSCGAVQY